LCQGAKSTEGKKGSGTLNDVRFIPIADNVGIPAVRGEAAPLTLWFARQSTEACSSSLFARSGSDRRVSAGPALPDGLESAGQPNGIAARAHAT